MNRLERLIVEAMAAAPDAEEAPFLGGLAALRREIGCDKEELKATVQRMRLAGRIQWDRLQLSPSMIEIGRGARGGHSPLPVAKGAEGDTTAPTAPEAEPSPQGSKQDAGDVREYEAVLHGRDVDHGHEARGGAAGGAGLAPEEQAEIRRDGPGGDVLGLGARGVADPQPERLNETEKAGSTCPAEREREKGALVPETAEEEEAPITLAAPPSRPLRRPPPAQPSPRPAAPVSLGAKGAPYQAPARASWIEQHLARRDRAREFLASKGRHPFRIEAGGTVKWQVPGWSGSHTDHDLIAIAREYGFEESANG